MSKHIEIFKLVDIYVTIVKLNGEGKNKTRSFLFTSLLSLTALHCSVLFLAVSTIPLPILVSGPLLDTFSWITILYLDGVESPRTKPCGTRFLPKWLFVFFSSSIVFTPLCFSSLDQFSFQNSLWFHWLCCFYSSPNPASEMECQSLGHVQGLVDICRNIGSLR